MDQQTEEPRKNDAAATPPPAARRVLPPLEPVKHHAVKEARNYPNGVGTNPAKVLPRLFNAPFCYTGRAMRFEFIVVCVLYLVVAGLCVGGSTWMWGEYGPPGGNSVVMLSYLAVFAVWVLATISVYAVAARRLHDCGSSSRWLLFSVCLEAVAVLVQLMILQDDVVTKGEAGFNVVLDTALLIVNGWLLLYMLFMDSEAGRNIWGLSEKYPRESYGNRSAKGLMPCLLIAIVLGICIRAFTPLPTLNSILRYDIQRPQDSDANYNPPTR